MNKKSTHLLLLGSLAFILLFLFLGRGVLLWDEAIYAQVSKEVIERGDWLTLHWNGHEWFHKPPVYFWATAVLFRLFGVSEFGARAVSALAGVGVVLVTYGLARILYGGAAGLLAGCLLLSAPLFVFFARFGTTDMTLTFAVFLAVYFYLRAEERGGFWAWAWLSCALALMVKGVAGVIAPAAIIIAALIDRRLFTALRHRAFWLGLAGAALVVGSWHLTMYLLHGEAFVRNYLHRHVLERSTSDLNNYGHGYGYYFGVLWEFFWPWVCVLPFALVVEFLRGPARARLLFVLAAMVLAIYTAAGTKFQWYILPVAPAFAVIIAGFITRLARKVTFARRRLALAAVVLLWVAGWGKVIPFYVERRKEMEAAAILARSAAGDQGAIMTYPENLQMTVRFYSNRKLCADPVINTLSYNESTACAKGEARHIIFLESGRGVVESRYSFKTLTGQAGLSYGEINAP